MPCDARWCANDPAHRRHRPPGNRVAPAVGGSRHPGARVDSGRRAGAAARWADPGAGRGRRPARGLSAAGVRKRGHRHLGHDRIRARRRRFSSDRLRSECEPDPSRRGGRRPEICAGFHVRGGRRPPDGADANEASRRASASDKQPRLDHRAAKRVHGALGWNRRLRTRRQPDQLQLRGRRSSRR